MVWNVGRISNIVFCPKSPNFYQYLNYTELQDGKKGKKMFDFRYFNAIEATERILWSKMRTTRRDRGEGRGRYSEYKSINMML